MHSLVIAATSVSIAAFDAVGLGLSVTAWLVLLVFGLAFLGVPHGALDPVAGKRLLSFNFFPWWITFGVAYLGIAVAVVLGWYVAPVFTCLLFFVLSAWHFGLEEDYAGPIQSVALRQLFAIARGSSIICVGSLFQKEEMMSILAQVMPSEGVPNAANVLLSTQASALALAPLAVIDLLIWFRSDQSSRLLVVLRVISLILLAATVNPLLAFGIYFCAWHSVRGLRELRAESRLTLPCFFLALAPLTAVTLMLGLGAFAFWSRSEMVTTSALRTVFLGLSAIAIPHLLLHATYRWAFNPMPGSLASREPVICN